MKILQNREFLLMTANGFISLTLTHFFMKIVDKEKIFSSCWDMAWILVYLFVSVAVSYTIIKCMEYRNKQKSRRNI